ncbi:MAG TPA: acyl-CoA desaturase [Actinobacteria bacterium]|nr:acyl-CoA desaturase [Actinomycetota bacterium]
MPPSRVTDAYDGSTPFPDTAPGVLPIGGPLQVGVTAALAVLPLAGLATAIWLAWGHGVGLTDLLLLAGLYVITGLGVTVGYHRYFTHRSFRAAPALRIALALAGSMAFEGSLIAWVGTHRRHHAFSDRPGDPHSPYRFGTSFGGMLRGLLHAHMGWMFHADPTPAERYVPDLLADRTLRKISGAFPALSVVSLAIPFALGWAIGGDLRAALLALLWGGAVRIALLQHITWSVNSLCHVIGSRPFSTRRFDRATNLWPLALLSFGESWHNLHHSDPTSARHGVGRGQIDLSAGLIALFERLGWAANVRWPSPERIEQHRRRADDANPERITSPDEVAEPAETLPDRVLTPIGG